MGRIDRIEVAEPDRWVRQAGPETHDHVHRRDSRSISSPRSKVIENPALALRDPCQDGWIATLNAPGFNTNQRNLVQASMVAP